MADGEVRAQDLTAETTSTLSGNEQFVMFDNTEGKRADIDDVATYIAGDKTQLQTDNKTSPVAAINELKSGEDDLKEDINDIVKVQSLTVPAGAPQRLPFSFIKGRTYRYTNNSSGIVNLNMVRADSTATLVTGSLGSGNSIEFICDDDDYVIVSSYFAGTGSAFLESVDDGIFEIAKDNRTDINKNGLIANRIINATDKDILFYTNIADSANTSHGQYWNSITTKGNSASYSCTEVPVLPNTTYCSSVKITGFSYYTDDNDTNLGALTANDSDRCFTTPNGCTKVRISWANLNEIVILTKRTFDALTYTKYPYNKYYSDIPENLYNSVNVLGAFRNIVNPSNYIDGSVWSGVDSIYASTGWHRIEAYVKPNHKYTVTGVNSAFSWLTNDNFENLGKVSNGVFTTPATCTRIRFSGVDSADIVLLDTEYTGAIDYDTFPYNIWKSKIDVDEISESMRKVVPYYDYTTLSMFPKIAIIGDSFESGGIYIDSQTGPYGMFYDLSWPSVLERRSGSTVNNYSKAGLSTRTWLTDVDRGLTKALADTPSNIYMGFLGINDYGIANYLGTIADIKSDYTQNPDTFYGNYARIIEQLQGHAPDAKFILVVPPLITAEYATAIENIANHYEIPHFRSNSDEFFLSDFYQNNKGTAHPVAMTYAGMALAYERLASLCIQDNAEYFFDVH